MANFEVLVEVQLRPGISDPQGATIERALPALGFAGISEIRAGKAFRFRVDAPEEGEARRVVKELCARLLANPVIEDATITVLQEAPSEAAAEAEAAGGPGSNRT
ncbi:MAG TPA: phosphoribosylformylglycinamidine synthase subunit PurS [Acidimicrobiales bacterium]|nr:phosphoribosylformylglycinamidine synthase subunit PurS [Acidimicrobiales bacterium]